MRYYFLISLLYFYLRATSSVTTDNTSKGHDFDFIIFTQHWPMTVCKEWEKENESHTCRFPKKQQQWTIHGIWPTKTGTMGPAFCNNSWHFDPELIKPIEDTLSDLWIDVEEGTAEYSLWVHEWSKHGTCAAALEPFNSEFKYFSRGINWMPQFDLSTALAKHNIVPSDDQDYSIKDIQNAIIQTWNVNPQIECRGEHGVEYLFEIRICFNKNLELMNCYSTMDISTNCNKDRIVYPLTLKSEEYPQYWYAEMYKLVSWLRWLTL